MPLFWYEPEVVYYTFMGETLCLHQHRLGSRNIQATTGVFKFFSSHVHYYFIFACNLIILQTLSGFLTLQDCLRIKLLNSLQHYIETNESSLKAFQIKSLVVRSSRYEKPRIILKQRIPLLKR